MNAARSGLMTVIAVLVLLVGCSRPESRMVGRWQWDNGQVAEYMEDGTAAWAQAGETIAGTWKINGDKLTLSHSYGQWIYTVVEVTDSTLKVERIPDGFVLTAVRLK